MHVRVVTLRFYCANRIVRSTDGGINITISHYSILPPGGDGGGGILINTHAPFAMSFGTFTTKRTQFYDLIFWPECAHELVCLYNNANKMQRATQTKRNSHTHTSGHCARALCDGRPAYELERTCVAHMCVPNFRAVFP